MFQDNTEHLHSYSTEFKDHFDIKCQLVQDKFAFEIQNVRLIYDILSAASESDSSLLLVKDSNQVSSLPHDLVSLLWTNSPDEALGKQMRMGDDSDRLTPDVIKKTGEGFQVIEVKTFSTSYEDQLLRTKKYLKPLKERSEKLGMNIQYDIVLVSSETVLCSFQLSDSQVMQLCSLYSLGSKLQNEAFVLGWRPRTDDPDLLQMMLNCLRSAKVLELPDDDLVMYDAHPDLSCDGHHHVVDVLKSQPEIKFEEQEVKGTKEDGHILKFPVFTILNEDSQGSLEAIQQVTGIDHLSSIWQKASNQASGLDFMHESYERWDAVFSGRIKADHEDSRMSTRWRVKIEPTQEERIFLATHGIQKKAMMHVPLVKESQRKKKEPYAPLALISDIDQFINYESHFQNWELHPLHQYIVSKICSESQDLYDKEFMMRVTGSLWFSCLLTLHSVFAEVNLSRRQNCKKDEFLLKSIDGTPLWLLIKPTKASSHIFVSIGSAASSVYEPLWPGKITKKFHTYGNVVLSEFFSLNEGKLSHLLYCAAKCLVIYSNSLHSFGDHLQDTAESRKVFNFCMLVYLEDKEKVSSDLLLMRYFYMEGLRSQPALAKVFEKLDPVLRSRLQVWLRVRLKTMIEMGAEVQLQNTLDFLKKGLNFITLKPLKTFSQILMLSYVGVLHNKEETNEVYGFFKIFNKVLKEEILMRKLPKDSATKCAGSKPGSHQFCPTLVHEAAKLVKMQIDKLGYEKFFQHDMPLHLLNIRWDDYATTKASFDFQSASHDEYRPSDVSSHRVKCMQAVFDMSQRYDSSRPLLAINEMVEDLKLQGGVRANLFRKLQLGGEREIYVLDMLSRICINFVEQISRKICSVLFGEMLTQPEDKLRISSAHYSLVQRLSDNDQVETLINSDDATTWAQKFTMPMFIHMFKEIVPPDYFKVILNILNLHTLKKLELPTRLLTEFAKHDQTNPQLQELKKQFMEGGDLLKKGHRFLTNRSNMMMGILHYTSSLYHWSLLRYVQVTGMKMARQMGEKLVVTFKVSSDDSSMICTTIGGVEPKSHKMTLKLKTLIMPFFGTLSSHHKSTYMVKQLVEEFNSKWYVRNSLISVPIKFSYAALSTNYQFNFMRRLENYASARSQMMAEGCGARMCSHVQIAQALCHYLSLGIDILPANRCFVEHFAHKHPFFGGFVFEPSKTCGLFGVKGVLNAFTDENWRWHSGLITNPLDMSESQGSNLVFKLGDFKKYKMMLESMEATTPGNYFAENPSELFVGPSSLRSEREKMKLKARNPAIAESFKFITMADTHVTSVYMLIKPVWYFSGEKMMLSDLAMKDPPDRKEDLRSFFCPESKIINSVQNMNYGLLIPKPSTRQRFLKLKVEKRGSEFLCSLLECVRFKWFGHKGNKTYYELNESWSMFLETFQWLRETFEETMAETKLSCEKLYSVVSSITSNGLTVQALTTASAKATDLETLSEIVKESQWSDLSYRPSEANQPINLENNNLYSLLCLAATGPNPARMIALVIDEYWNQPTETEMTRMMTRLSEDEKKMALFCYKVKGGKIPKSMMLHAKAGKICFSRVTHQGLYYTVTFPKTNIGLLVSNNELKAVIAENVYDVLRHRRELLSTIHEIGVTKMASVDSKFKFDSQMLLTKGFGVPLKQNTVTEMYNPDLICWEVTQSGVMRLFTKLKTVDREQFATVFRFNPKIRSFKIPDCKSSYPEPHDSWMKFKSLDLSQGLELLASGDEWAWASFEVRYLSRTQTQVSRLIKMVQTMEREHLDESFLNMAKDIDFSILDEFLPIEDEAEEMKRTWAEMAEILDPTLLSDFNFIEQYNPVDIRVSHPFWDETVDAIKTMRRLRYDLLAPVVRTVIETMDERQL